MKHAPRTLLGFVLAFAVAACTGESTEDETSAPPGTVSRYVSSTAPVPPSVAAQQNAAIAAAALPSDADVPGYTRPADQPTTVLKLCPTIVEVLETDVVRASVFWRTAAQDASIYAVAVLDPVNAPADRLMATLAPPDCPDRDEGGTRYVHDRQPYERDGWTGWLNTSLATPLSGARYYQSSYLLSKGDALVNVAADRVVVDATTSFDPTVDAAATHCLEVVLDRFAV
jgi:hypothetical protein